MEYRDRDLLDQQSQSPLGGADSGTKSDTKQHRKRECADGRQGQEYVLSLFCLCALELLSPGRR